MKSSSQLSRNPTLTRGSQQIVDFIVVQEGKLPKNPSQHVDGLLAGGPRQKASRIRSRAWLPT